MNDLKIISSGMKDLLNPMSEYEMSFLIGGDNKDKDTVTCKKGYTAKGCECGYTGPVINP